MREPGTYPSRTAWAVLNLHWLHWLHPRPAAARSLPCLAWRAGGPWHRPQGVAQDQAAIRGPLPTWKSSNLRSPPKHQTAKLPFIPPASRVTRLAACCVLRAASLRHYTGISSTPYPTAPWTGFDAHPPSTLRFSSATTRRRHSSRARPNFKLSALLQPPTTPSLETPIIAAPYHRTIESSQHSYQLLSCVPAAEDAKAKAFV